jgi:hypothetical protein
MTDELMEKAYKGWFLLISSPLWLPGLLALKLYEWLL